MFQRPRMFAFMLITMAVLLAGCTMVTTAEQNTIDAQNANAQAWNTKVQALQQPVSDEQLGAIKTWTAGDTTSWSALSDWSHGRRPPPTTQP